MAVPPVIDFHVHMLEEEVFRRASDKSVFTGFGTRRPPLIPNSPFERLHQRQLNPQLQIEDMDERGVDRHLVSSSTVIQGSSWADPQTDLELNRRCNDAIAAWCARYPKRFVGSLSLPLQDIDLALGEFERATKDLGLRVANVSSSYKEAYLGAPRFRPFWEKVVKQDITVWIHPEGVRDPWFQQFGLWNSLGQSIEETKAMASLIYEGIFETFPTCKIVMAHGGGYAPHYMGRMDRNYLGAPERFPNIRRKPSDYLRSFYYDTCVYDPSVLQALIQRVGPDRLVMGSDYPVGDPDPIGSLQRATTSAEDLAMMKGGTAARLLGLSSS